LKSNRTESTYTASVFENDWYHPGRTDKTRWRFK